MCTHFYLTTRLIIRLHGAPSQVPYGYTTPSHSETDSYNQLISHDDIVFVSDYYLYKLELVTIESTQ